MTFNDFKREAQRRGHFFDNKDNASAAWAKSWGLTYHSHLWFYKEYTLGNMRWKGGSVRLRHGSYRSVDCFIGDEQVSEYRFKKALETFEAPALTTEEQEYINKQNSWAEQQLAKVLARCSRPSRRKRKQYDSRQLTFQFASA